MEENGEAKSWGVYLSMDYGDVTGVKANYPEWVRKHRSTELGPTQLIIWNNLSQKASVLSASESLILLEKLNSGNDWQIEGVPIMKRVLEFKVPIGQKKKGKKIPEENPQTSEKSKWVEVVEVILPPEAGGELHQLLKHNQKKLQSLADEEAESYRKKLSEVYKLIFEFGRDAEEKDVNFAARNFAWTRMNSRHQWECYSGEIRGMVKPGNDWVDWWARIIFGGNREKSKYDFKKLIDAVTWVEREIEHPDPDLSVNIDEPIPARPERLAHLRERVKLYPFQIKPEDLDSTRRTYHLVVDVETKPIKSEKFETLWGDSIEVSKKFVAPIKLALEIGIDPDLYQIEQPLGENTKWFRFTSLTSYLLESLAMNQAQNAWNQSKILHQFKAGSVTRARYGYFEIETHYPVYLGECSEGTSSWAENHTRQEFLEKQAFRNSVFHSLIVEDVRCYLDIDKDTLSDLELLMLMHEARADSKFLNPSEKIKSQIWLSENQPKKNKGDNAQGT